MLHEVAQKAAQEGEKLMKARADFALLKKEEEQYLKDREVKAQDLLKKVHTQTASAEKVLDSVRDKIINKLQSIRGKVDELIGGLVSILDRARKISETAESIKEKNEEVGKKLDEAYEFLQDKIGEVSEFEKDLKKQQKEVEETDRKATEKLRKAKDIAFWHKSGKGSYTDTVS